MTDRVRELNTGDLVCCKFLPPNDDHRIYRLSANKNAVEYPSQIFFVISQIDALQFLTTHGRVKIYVDDDIIFHVKCK